MASPTSVSSEEIRASSYVGFDSITSQIEHKLLKRGFQFNVIVVGTYAGTRVMSRVVNQCIKYRSDGSRKVNDD